MLLAMFVAGTTKSFSQNMNKRTEETPQSVIANVHKAVDLLKEKALTYKRTLKIKSIVDYN